jgi:hypothetical protein
MTLPTREITMIQKPSAYDLFDPERYAVLERMAATLLASGMLPQILKQPAQVIAIMLKSYELGVPPMEGLSGIAVIQGKPTVSPQLMLALIERSGAGSITILEREAHQSVVEAHRRGRKPVVFLFTFEDAKKLGLAGKDNYLKQPAVMLQWRNVAAAARAVFPDVISGLYTPDEMGVDIQILEDGTQEIITVSEPQEAMPNPVRVSKLGSEPVTRQEAAQTTLESIPGVTRGAPVQTSEFIGQGEKVRLARAFEGLNFTDEMRYAVYQKCLGDLIYAPGEEIPRALFKGLLAFVDAFTDFVKANPLNGADDLPLALDVFMDVNHEAQQHLGADAVVTT